MNAVSKCISDYLMLPLQSSLACQTLNPQGYIEAKRYLCKVAVGKSASASNAYLACLAVSDQGRLASGILILQFIESLKPSATKVTEL